MREPMDIVTRISQRATDLRPAEQKVAQAVLGDIAGQPRAASRPWPSAPA